MKRVLLAIAGLGLLLFLSVPLLAFWFKWNAGAFDKGKQVIDDLDWVEVKSTGSKVALSWNREAINFFDIGDLALSSQPLVQDVLNKLSSASGVRIERGPDKKWSIGIFHDTNVFTRLKNDKQAFRVMDVPDYSIEFLTEKSGSDARCVTMTTTDHDANIDLTVILSSQQSDFSGCLVAGLLDSFGIRASETVSARELVSACVLYEARRIGLRDRQHISEQALELREKCLQRVENDR